MATLAIWRYGGGRPDGRGGPHDRDLSALRPRPASSPGVDEVTDTRVPAFPHVLIIVTDAAVMVDGEVVDRGSAGDPDASIAIQLGVHSAARKSAQRLGRPVRATLRCKGEEKRIILQPNGSYSEAEESKPASTPVVSVAAPGTLVVPVKRQTRHSIRAVVLVDRAKFATSAAYVALGTVLISGLLLTGSDGEEPAQVAEGALEAPPATGVSPHGVVVGDLVERLPAVSGVVADSDTGGFNIRVTTGRAARVQVQASPVAGNGAARVWTIRTTGATTRTLAFDDLEAGSYRWVVRSEGERPRTGNVVVASEPPVVDTVDDASEPDSTPDSTPDDTSSTPPSDTDDGGGDSTMPGPTGPVDPDDPTNP